MTNVQEPLFDLGTHDVAIGELPFAHNWEDSRASNFHLAFLGEASPFGNRSLWFEENALVAISLQPLPPWRYEQLIEGFWIFRGSSILINI